MFAVGVVATDKRFVQRRCACGNDGAIIIVMDIAHMPDRNLHAGTDPDAEERVKIESVNIIVMPGWRNPVTRRS